MNDTVFVVDADRRARLATVYTPDSSGGLAPTEIETVPYTMNVEMDPASPLRGEYGWDGTAGTVFWIHPAREMITILMTQSTPPNPDRIRQKFKALVDAAVIDPGR